MMKSILYAKTAIAVLCLSFFIAGACGAAQGEPDQDDPAQDGQAEDVPAEDIPAEDGSAYGSATLITIPALAISHVAAAGGMPAASQDAPWKRKARIEDARGRLLYRPELMYHGSVIESSSEAGSRHAAGAVMPLTDDWELAILDRVSYFALKQGISVDSLQIDAAAAPKPKNPDGKAGKEAPGDALPSRKIPSYKYSLGKSTRSGRYAAGRESLELRLGKKPGNSLRPWLSVTPYTNFGDAKGEHVSIASGFSKTWKNGAGVFAELFAWRPWDEGYYTILNDGQRHGGALTFSWPWGSRFALSGRVHYEELALGTAAKSRAPDVVNPDSLKLETRASGKSRDLIPELDRNLINRESGWQYAGNRYGVNAKGYLKLLKKNSGFMGYGFRNEDLWNEFLVGSELGIYANVDWQRYNRPDAFNAFYPVPKVFAQQLGVSGQYAFSPHFGVSCDAYLGRDPERDLKFGEIGGVNARMTVVINPHFRLWGSYIYSKSGATLESGSGAENIFSIGFNYKF